MVPLIPDTVRTAAPSNLEASTALVNTPPTKAVCLKDNNDNGNGGSSAGDVDMDILASGKVTASSATASQACETAGGIPSNQPLTDL